MIRNPQNSIGTLCRPLQYTGLSSGRAFVFVEFRAGGFWVLGRARCFEFRI